VEREVDEIATAGLTRRTAFKGLGVAALAVLAGRASLAGAAAQDATPSGGDYPTVGFTARDFAFVGLPASVPGGLTRLSMTQEGPSDHHAMFMRLNDGATADDFVAALQAGDFGALLGAATSLGGPNAGALGTTTNVVVDLAPGRYMVACLIPDEETGMLHAAMGMLTPMEVTEGGAAPEPPASDVAIDLVEFAFPGLSSEVAAGRHTWAITDTGAQPHELVVYRWRRACPTRWPSRSSWRRRRPRRRPRRRAWRRCPGRSRPRRPGPPRRRPVRRRSWPSAASPR
jgi:hypothetical protein